MSEVELFFKELVESKKFKKLKSVNSILNTTSLIDCFGKNLPCIIDHLTKHHSIYGWIIINANVRLKDRRSEYLINQQYTIKIGYVLDYYNAWSRDKKLQNILA